MRHVFRLGERVVAVEARRGADGSLEVVVDGRAERVERVAEQDGVIVLRLQGRTFRVHVGAALDRRFAQVEGGPVLEALAGEAATARARRQGAGEDTLVATMHGQVVKVLASEGQAVARGDALVVLEAMKMELRVVAPHDGVVKRVACTAGEVVERGRVLVELESQG